MSTIPIWLLALLYLDAFLLMCLLIRDSKWFSRFRKWLKDP